MVFKKHYLKIQEVQLQWFLEQKHLKNIHVSAYEEDGKITFLHKIKEGSVDKSYGIHVAKLANLPDSVIQRASEILTVYESNEKKRDIKIQEALPIDELMPKKTKIEEELEKINPLEITPMEALNILYKLKNEIKWRKLNINFISK